MALVDLFITDDGRFSFFVDYLFVPSPLSNFYSEGILFIVVVSSNLLSLLESMNFLLCSFKLVLEDGAMSSCSLIELILFMEKVSKVYCSL